MRDFHRAQEDDEFEVRNVDAGAEHVHRHDDAGCWPVAELPDALEWPVDRRAPRDLRNEAIATTEDVPRLVDELVRVRRVRQVIRGKDERLGEAPVALLVRKRVRLEFFEDLLVASPAR